MRLQELGLVLIWVAASFALTSGDVKQPANDEKTSKGAFTITESEYHCDLKADLDVWVKDHKQGVHHCVSAKGEHLLLASDTPDTLLTVKIGVLLPQQSSTDSRPKRQYDGYDGYYEHPYDHHHHHHHHHHHSSEESDEDHHHHHYYYQPHPYYPPYFGLNDYFG